MPGGVERRYNQPTEIDPKNILDRGIEELEKRLNDLSSSAQIEDEIRSILETFDNDLETVLVDLMQNRLRFNTFIRIFLSALVVEIDRAGQGWRKAKVKGELPICNPRITKFALDPHFDAYITQNKIELPKALKTIERYENRSWLHGSPRI